MKIPERVTCDASIGKKMKKEMLDKETDINN